MGGIVKLEHEELAGGRWRQLSFVTQMAHIGGEVERALNWRGKNNQDYSMKALERSLELLDMSLETAVSKSRLKELARVREALADYFIGENIYGSTDKAWRNYFTPFAFSARAHS